ncbi:MAG: polyamine aminopropyltransferase [Oscillospiraceae bacterium]|jgi:spermidine synthase
MELWFTENHTKNVRFSIRVDRQIFSAQSDFQRIDIYESYEFGRILTLDGYLMLTEKDEFIYHEMMVHVPMAVHPSAKNILVIGGGDGGVVRELVRYSTVESIDLVDIDPMVIDVSRKYLQFTACKLGDPRVRIYYEDGVKFIRRQFNAYDVIIVDSTDPFGPGEGLFTKEFYGSCYKALRDDGILVNQHESPFYPEDGAAMQRAHRRIVQSFPISRVYQAHIPTYPSGHWMFGFASKKYHPISSLRADEWKALGIETDYYTTNLHMGCFYIPKYVERMLRDVE